MVAITKEVCEKTIFEAITEQLMDDFDGCIKTEKMPDGSLRVYWAGKT